MSEIPYRYKGAVSKLGPHLNALGDIFMGTFESFELWWRPAVLPPSDYPYDKDFQHAGQDIFRLRRNRENWNKISTWTRILVQINTREPSMETDRFVAFHELVRRVDALCPQHRKELVLQAKFRLDSMVVA